MRVLIYKEWDDTFSGFIRETEGVIATFRGRLNWDNSVEFVNYYDKNTRRKLQGEDFKDVIDDFDKEVKQQLINLL